MTGNREIQEAAFQLVAEHGDKAPIHAAMEADARLEAGDMDGAAHWRLVLAVVREMVEPGGVRH
jgi:hypothetical protein